MTRIRIFPYKAGSRGAKALACALGGKVLRLTDSRYTYRNGDFIINWGSSDCPFPAAINASGVDLVSNKLTFFNRIKEHDFDSIIPPYWTDPACIPDEAFPIVCRTILNGHSGVGIVIADTRNDLVPAPLYVQYVKKKDEYRVHLASPLGSTGVSCPSTLAVQRKARRLDCENPDWQVRNHANGFVFVRNGVNPPPAVLEVAAKGLKATGLNFGAVDVIWNEQQQRAYVLEINSAPGLEGQTIEDYAHYFKEIINA